MYDEIAGTEALTGPELNERGLKARDITPPVLARTHEIMFNWRQKLCEFYRRSLRMANIAPAGRTVGDAGRSPMICQLATFEPEAS